jgi:hypothetical protein
MRVVFYFGCKSASIYLAGLFPTPWPGGRRSERFTVNDPSAGSPTERRNLWKSESTLLSAWLKFRLEALSSARTREACADPRPSCL